VYRINIKQKLFSFIVVGALAAVSAFAGTIVVSNASFENLPLGGLPNGCGAGCSYSSGGIPIPGWTSSDSTPGQFQPGSSSGNFIFFNSVPDGITTAYSNGGTISQVVAPTVQVGVTYTLQVDVGARNDLPFNSFVDLLINGNLISAVGVTPTAGNWSTYTATYTGLAADVGQAITIQLATGGAQGNYDNVRLSDDLNGAAPEPATAAVFTLGLAGILAYARSKRNC